MNHLGPLHESDRLLDLFAARRPLSPDDRDPLALALAEWAREVDGPTRAGRAGVRVASGRGRLAAGGLLVATLMTGSSVAAAMTGAQVPVLSSVGGAIVHLLPESWQPPVDDLTPHPETPSVPGPATGPAVGPAPASPPDERASEPTPTTAPRVGSGAVRPPSSSPTGQDAAPPSRAVVTGTTRPGGPGEPGAGPGPTITPTGPPPAGVVPVPPTAQP